MRSARVVICILSSFLLVGTICPVPVLAVGKKLGTPITMTLAKESAQLKKVAVGDEITTTFFFTPHQGADAMNISVQAVTGLALLSAEELSFPHVTAGERRSTDIRLKVLAPSGQIFIRLQMVTGEEASAKNQNVFYELVNGSLRVYADKLKLQD